MNVPSYAWTLMPIVYRDVLPNVHRELKKWKEKAMEIPDEELRKQALNSIQTKTFHCEGGAILSLLARHKRNEAIRFIVAYQTISDYLDNLCDRSTSLDPNDFHSLHQAMSHALTPGKEPIRFYQFRKEQDDGGYLNALIETCQNVLAMVSNQEQIARYTHKLASYYCDLQVHKHVKVEERVPRLVKWFETYRGNLPEMSWFEFSACAGSTLGIFCLVSYALHGECDDKLLSDVADSYFPWVQGLHILLDYFIDQEEDREGGDLNFCFYYENEEELAQRFAHFVKQAEKSVARLPDAKFHHMINNGMLGIYLADRKVREQKDVYKLAKRIVRLGGRTSLFFYINGWIYRRLRKV